MGHTSKCCCMQIWCKKGSEVFFFFIYISNAQSIPCSSEYANYQKIAKGRKVPCRCDECWDAYVHICLRFMPEKPIFNCPTMSTKHHCHIYILDIFNEAMSGLRKFSMQTVRMHVLLWPQLHRLGTHQRSMHACMHAKLALH